MAAIAGWLLHCELHKDSDAAMTHIAFRRDVTMSLLQLKQKLTVRPGPRVHLRHEDRKTDGHYIISTTQQFLRVLDANATTGSSCLVSSTCAVSLDARPVLIPILSSVICFPIVALAVICALRYRALRLRRKEHLRRLRGGGMRAARLEIPGRRSERPSFFSRDSSSGDTSSRPPNNIEAGPRTTGPVASSSSSSSGDNYEDELEFTRELASSKRKSLAGSGSRRNSRVTFGAAAAILQVPGLPSPLSGSPKSGSPHSASPRSCSPRSSLYPRSGSVSFYAEPSFILDVVNDYDDDADDEDDLEATDCGADAR
ncbi:hypothetical protein MRX96_008092 [Rhipicephalus microplus]